MLKVLVVDDQPAVCMALRTLFELHGLGVAVAASPGEALALIASEDIGVVLQDMNFRRGATSGEEGFSLLRSIRALDPELPVLVMTAFTSIPAAVELVKAGASDYLAKPWDDDKLVTTVKNLVRMRALSQENLRLRAQRGRARAELARGHDLQGLVYASAEMHEVVSLAVKVARSSVSVLVRGPNGTGKERLASIVQANSRRAGAPFVKLNCGALPDELLEAELFGAEAGAFTGATKLRVGRFEEADGGTLFLDEVGNLSPNGQRKLLRVLQTGELQRLGSSVTRRVDVRIISATNADLGEAIAAGAFREDLYFRLNVIELAIPALRDRPDDIEPLAEHLLAKHQPEGGAPLVLGEAARREMHDHDWPGNVRELDNRIVRAALVSAGPVIEPVDLGLPAAPRPEIARGSQAPPSPERAEIERALVEARGVIATAAARLGVSRQALYRRMDRLGIQLEKKLR